MRKLARVSVFCAAISLGVISAWSLANANMQQHMLASPFVAADKPDSPKFNASVVSTGKRNPFAVTAKESTFAGGNYSGVLIESQDRSITPRGLYSLGFSYKGSNQGEATVEYTGPGMVINRATAAFGGGRQVESAKDGYKKVLFTAADLGIPSNSSIHKIVIAPPPGGVGRMLVDEITLNGDPVKKAMHTLFYKVINSSPTGPLSAVAATGCSSQTTSVGLRNMTGSPVKIFFTLGVVTGCETNVQAIFPQMTLNTPGVTTIGYIMLNPKGAAGDSIFSNVASCYSGSFSAESVRINCSTDRFPTGQSLAEFIVNNGFQAGTPQETVDISCVTGVNAIWKFTMDGGQSVWTTTTDTRKVPPTTKVVRDMQNAPNLYGNTGREGVFPFGCTNCTNYAGVPCCAPPITPGTNPNSSNPPGCEQQGTVTSSPPPPSTKWDATPPVYQTCNPDWAPICNVQRPASCNGGTITIDYLGPAKAFKKDPPTPPKKFAY